MHDVWTAALRGLQPRLGARTYDLWLRPLVLQEIDGQHLRLAAPSRFMKEWFENHYLQAVLDEIHQRTSRRYTVQVDVLPTAAPTDADDPVPDPQHPTASIEFGPPSTQSSIMPHTGGGIAHGPSVSADPRAALDTLPLTLSDRYRFSTFIKGASNELAATAAWSVAQAPGTRFNPLFIYGGVGLGKTHLLHAVGHTLRASHSDLRISYLSAERFMNEFISAVRFNQFDGFRSRYRDRCDVLLIDDIQFIAGRDRTMDEFFHVFNALYEAGKQIMVTADCTPSQMPGMEDRLTSRLNWGLVADIKAPDLETRVAILRQKAEADAIPIADAVTVYLANRMRSNVRELEGALIRVHSFAALKGVPITEQFIGDLLGDPADDNGNPPTLTVESIQKTVAGHFALRIADLKGPRRHKGISRPRMIAMYLSRELTKASFPEIGLRFGGKDHSTVINACRRIDAIQRTDTQLRATIDTLRAQFQQNTQPFIANIPRKSN